MLQLDPQQLMQALPHTALIPALRRAFREGYTVPPRHLHDYPNPEAGTDSTLLLMPAWQTGRYLGVKIATVSPANGTRNLPAVQGYYVLFEVPTGQAIAQLDARMLTALRTAAASALASSFLSRSDSTTLLMVGTGALAPHLIRAHAAVRPIEKVYVWGRNFSKARDLANQFSGEKYDIHPAEALEPVVPEADIVSCATLSPSPLVKGAWLRPGQHLDLVGSFRPDMREADDLAVARARIFVDSYDGIHESGDLVQPLQNGTLQETDIQADLFELCREQKPGRQSDEAITLFKSVGHALEDLAAAILVYEGWED